MNADKLVFLSHSSDDTWVARQIAKAIQETGASTFLDEADVDLTDQPDEKIRQALECADEMLVLMTPWAVKRPYIWAEIGAAWVKQLPFVLVLYGLTREDFRSRPEAPAFLKATNFITLNEIDRYFDELRRKLSKAT